MENINLDDCKYLGHGENGKVYLMPNGKAIKICKNEEVCKEEYEVLKIAKKKKSHYFPKIYKRDGNIMIREYVDGKNLREYIKKNGLSKKLAVNLIKMIEEFKKLGFKRLDMRWAHIYVIKNEKVKVIDPSMQLIKEVKYPRRMLKDLKKLGVQKKFYRVLKKKRPKLYHDWRKLEKRNN